jgi:hypothetical protein
MMRHSCEGGNPEENLKQFYKCPPYEGSERDFARWRKMESTTTGLTKKDFRDKRQP